jgi:short-subunit dehydrogenase/FAD/FMN-containing dehydrogenase
MQASLEVNDVHSQLNRTRVAAVVQADSTAAIQAIVRQARLERRAISIAGGRHAMGAQQFGTDTILLDMGRMDKVLSFDQENGFLVVQAGIRWPELLEYLARSQQGMSRQWGVRQKQTGADRLSIGGALSANAHGRGLRFKPMIGDVESFTLVDADANVRTCSRTQDAELFRLAIGGYGLFGVIAEVKLRLAPRQKVQRVVRVIDLDELVPAIEQRIADGYLYGDFQFDIDSASEGFLTRGVFSCYRPVDERTPMPERQRELQPEEWSELFYLAHTDRKKAFEAYTGYYLTTDGQLYWSDTHQLAEYLDNYHEKLNERLGPTGRGTEMITEVYVPRKSLLEFMRDVRKDLGERQAHVIYGTIRFIEKDNESFLPWAKERYACIIFNLHTAHDSESLAKTAGDFRRLIDRAIQYGGSYYLTYHHWATRAQVEACYPRFAEFLVRKLQHDPEERFQSDWYRLYKRMFADALPANVPSVNGSTAHLARVRVRPGSVLITGASSGIGHELAKRFAQDGHDLVLIARGREVLEQIGKELSDSTGATVRLIAKDLSHPGAAKEIFDELRRESIHISVLVNCAGFGTYGPFVETEPAAEREMMQVNMVALTELTKLAVREMVPRRDGRILNVASTAAFQPGPRMAVYYATKAYVLSFSEALANELAGTGVTVSTLCPGPTRTGFGRRAKMEGARVYRVGVMDPAVVADAGYRGLMKGKAIIIPGLGNTLLALAARLGPRKLVAAVVRWLNGESANPGE